MLKDVNTTNIPDAIRLGCQTMCSVFNRDDNEIPFFGSCVWPDASLSFSEAHSEAHVPGRHLNALLHAEDALGISLDEESVEKHARAAFYAYSGPLPLPLNRPAVDDEPVVFIAHNIREGFHALYALAKYRNSNKASKLAEASIETIFKYWDPEKGWDEKTITGKFGLTFIEGGFIPGIARCIGPLVKYYKATGYKPALELARLLREKATAECFLESGRYDINLFGSHAHSVTCVMSSLAQLADATGDQAVLDRVKAFYDNGLWQLRDEIGWCTEIAGARMSSDMGEMNCSGDILETALILGKWGHAEYYHDAERMLRSHILPAQLRDISFIQDPPNPYNEDGKRDVAKRHKGAFGFPAPYGHQPAGAMPQSLHFNMDIVGGTVDSLCQAYRHIAWIDENSYRVNLLFDYETEDIKIQSPYTHSCLRIWVKHQSTLYVRVPPWAKLSSINISGRPEQGKLQYGFLVLENLPRDSWTNIKFPLAEQDIILQPHAQAIRARLRGDKVIAMDNLGKDFTFFNHWRIQLPSVTHE